MRFFLFISSRQEKKKIFLREFFPNDFVSSFPHTPGFVVDVYIRIKYMYRTPKPDWLICKDRLQNKQTPKQIDFN